MNKLLISLFLLVGFSCMISCNQNIDWSEGLSPIVVTLSLSQYGEQVVNLSESNSEFQFTIRKNYPMLKTNVSFTILSSDELNGHTPLSSKQFLLSDSLINFSDADREQNVSIRFKNLTDLNPEEIYAIGLRINSSNNKVKVDEHHQTIIITLRLGEKGTITNPHRLSSMRDLKGMKDKLKEGQINYFKMAADIDVGDEEWEVLNYDRRYMIHFDGDNHIIRNLKCDGEAASFFGVLNDGVCENVVFENAMIQGNNTPIGIVAGIVQRSIVRNVHVSGSVFQTGGVNNWTTGKAGGICGSLEESKSIVTECSADVKVMGDFIVGGLVGEANRATLTSRSFAIGEFISTHGFAGGIIGNMYQTTVSECYSGGLVSTTGGSGAAGGIVGRIDRGAEVYNCYSISSVDAHGNAGGIVGTTAWGTNPKGNVISGCVAWNVSIRGTDQNSSRIAGFMNGGSVWGNACYAKTSLKVTVPNGFPQTDPYWMDTEELNTTERAKVYNGIDSFRLIETTEKVLGWNPYVWDFTGEEPFFNWENKKEKWYKGEND